LRSEIHKKEKEVKKFGFCDGGLVKEVVVLQRVCLDFGKMGNCWCRWESSDYRVSSNVKSGWFTNKIALPFSVLDIFYDFGVYFYCLSFPGIG